MDIHKPKPWHGVREFLKEYLIIVVGVLTALAAEQAVEWLHWRHVAAEAEAHLAADMGPNLVNAAERLAIEPCLQARVAELATALQSNAPTWSANFIKRTGPNLPVMPQVVGGPGRQWPHVAWENALASGALAHLPRERVDQYASLYRLVELARDHQGASAFADAELSPLGFDRPLTPAERTAFLGRLAISEQQDRAVMGVSRTLLQQAWAMGLRPAPAQLAEVMAREREVRGACIADVKLPPS